MVHGSISGHMVLAGIFFDSETAAVAFLTNTVACNVNVSTNYQSSLTPAGDWQPANQWPFAPYNSFETRAYTVNTLNPNSGCANVQSSNTLNGTRSFACPSPYVSINGATNPYCTTFFTGYIYGQLLECPSNGSPSTSVGDPCNVSTGDFSQTESDYSGAGLSFTRYYHSAVLESSHALGIGWTHNYAAYLILTNGNPSGLLRPDGHQDALDDSKTPAGVWIGNSGSGIHVQQSGSNWIASLKNGDSEVYSSTGQLIQKVAANGEVTTLSYNASGQLASVNGPFGHTLQFTYNATGEIGQVIDPAGNPISYGYDGNNNLTSVTYQDLSVRQYLFEDSSLPNNLTGIIDENSSRFLTVAYDDSTGAVASSQQAGGAQSVSISYTANGAVATSASGEVDTYTFTSDSRTSPRANSFSRNNLLQTFMVQGYSGDPQQRVSQSVDANGNITTYSYDVDQSMVHARTYPTSRLIVISPAQRERSVGN
jgi:YD repeat-containing protein